MSDVKRYRGRTPGEAMRKARDAEGDDARLVSARRVSAPDAPAVYEVQIAQGPEAAEIVGGGLDALRREIESLRRMISDLKVEPPRVEPAVVEPREAAPISVAPGRVEPQVEPEVAPIAVRPQVEAEIEKEAPPVAVAPPEREAKSEAEKPAVERSEERPRVRPKRPPREAPVFELEVDENEEKWVDVLRRRGVGRAHARRIVERALRENTGRGPQDEFEALSKVLADEFRDTTDDHQLGERSTVLVGPTGAGKTTVLAKIATELVRRGVRPVLVSTDGESLAGAESLQSVAEALDLRFETAFLAGQLETVMDRHGRDETFLVDTPGRSPFVPDGVESLRPTVRAAGDAEVLLVFPATTDGEEARALIDGYAALGVDRIVLTKLDELCRPGRIVDLAKAVTRPIASVTYGRAARGASAGPGDPRIVSRILGTSRSLEARA